ncbi:hypothetical protein D3C81_1304090 [compost metagenome]
MGQVVDVFTGAGEVDEFTHLGQFWQLGSLLFEQVLNGLDVVVGGALDFFHALGVLEGELIGQTIEQCIGFGGKRWNFSDLRMSGEALQPAHLDQGAETDQAVFAENRAQGLGFAGVAAVNRGNRSERGKLHGVFSDSQALKRAHIIHEKCARVGWLTNGPPVNLWLYRGASPLPQV